MLAVIDTNIWVSAIISPHGLAARVAAIIGDGLATPIFCAEVVFELQEAVSEPRFVQRYGWRLNESNRIVATLNAFGIALTAFEIVPVVRDPRGDIFVAMAIAAHADCLVTGDKDLHDSVVVEYLRPHGVDVVTVREFVERIEGAKPDKESPDERPLHEHGEGAPGVTV